MWNNPDAQANNLDALAEKLLNLLQQMDENPALRKNKFAWAKINNQLGSMIVKWGGMNDEIAVFLPYFHARWDREEAINDPGAFAEVQLSLLQRMNDDFAMRLSQFSIARMALRQSDPYGTDRADR